MLVTEVLEDLGYTAIEAADGAAGLRVLQSDARIRGAGLELAGAQRRVLGVAGDEQHLEARPQRPAGIDRAGLIQPPDDDVRKSSRATARWSRRPRGPERSREGAAPRRPAALQCPIDRPAIARRLLRTRVAMRHGTAVLTKPFVVEALALRIRRMIEQG
jgi:CheY-like chemotaxis protein